MRATAFSLVFAGLLVNAATPLTAQRGGGNAAADESIKALVAGFTLDSYKSTIKGLTQFGDRRQGTKRNRDAIDWIEARLKSYGCTNTERIRYEYAGRQLRLPVTAATTPAPGRGNAAGDTTGGRGTGRGNTGRGNGQGAATTPPPAGRGATPVPAPTLSSNVIPNPPVRYGRGGTGVNTDSLKQPDARIRALDAEPDTPGPREEVYCTKIGTTHPEEMYIVGGHMDGHGFNEAVNDDGSGTAIVMEMARILHQPGVTTDRSIRFILWNNEETGLNGSKAYVEQRAALQGIESPKGSGKYPEPKWLGMIQHDMMMWDHGAPDSTGKVSPVQRKEADINIEFSWSSKMATESMQLAWQFRAANERFATDYPAAVGYRMSNTDSDSFKDFTATISLRENERIPHTRDGWNPTWHQPTDVWSTFSDKDFLLGMNAGQTTLSAVAILSGATIKK